MAKDNVNRTMIRDVGIVQCLKKLLGHPSESIQRLTAGILNELSTDMDGAFILQNEGIADPVNALINSRNEKIGKNGIKQNFGISAIHFISVSFPSLICHINIIQLGQLKEGE